MNKLFHLMISILLLSSQVATGHAAGVGASLNGIKVEFELTNADGELVTEQDIHGRYVLLAFGFTHCLHICPMMAANMAMALKASQQDALGIFVSVDSERDTPAVTHAYASSFHDSMLGLGGTYDQIRQAANNFKVSFVVTKSQKAYTVEHTSDIFLIGPDDNIDAVVLVTPNSTHVPQMIAAAEHGKHVFCEKPFALTGAGARQAVAAADRARVTVIETNVQAVTHIMENMRRDAITPCN